MVQSHLAETYFKNIKYLCLHRYQIQSSDTPV